MPSIFACLHSYICSLTKTMSRKFQGSDESRLGSSEKDRYFLKIAKWQHKFVQNYNRGKLVSYFLNNGTKTCLYGLKISENIEIEEVFQFIVLFHITSNLHTSCFITFKGVEGSSESVKACVCYFSSIFYFFHQMIVLQKLRKMFFI